MLNDMKVVFLVLYWCFQWST